ncbi:tetratricopeptide repeat protein [Aetokthonos hydrillicola Thurmond2011]|uniref:Tetratricopeptide repeat protein n=1 Tax=Aetokthonos hydrillicola Thurmond2011 TaxID=2712845 RepID=A0AAP5IAY9_9CYAN|nr:tetratricopeptide repeat protein [Aetokthonos hydrillicola]MBO3462381.1 tetratricopeptide repeat protein [Aetokthonos hydrillicola CCALA 1050]MBW4590393.1 tetratricopeptide repeat protein [Aetokthonos hydrillicola CCALA 1050]MDR9898195.1 tetratricopeptide repeat protein [Aetokthonos hydrillicola Thurmond2011]
MSESLSLRDRYLALIDEIVQNTLKGKISSQEQVYQMLLKGITTDTGEVFELALSDRLTSTQQQVETEKDELKQAKATRSLRAIKTIQSQWQRAQEQNKANYAIASAAKEITTADSKLRLAAFLRVVDPNRKYPLSLQQIQQLSKSLQTFAQADTDIQQISDGIIRGVASWQRLQDQLVSWMYEQSQALGFGGIPGERGPWATWAKQVNSELPGSLFRTLAMEKSVIEFVQQQRSVTLSDWVEIALILQYLQRGLVNWFDQQTYNIQAGSKLSISTFLTFAVIWSQLANALDESTVYGKASSQVLLQILRTFTQRSYFPLYGGIFASFSGTYLRDALNYLNEPLRQAEGTQEKARILTLLGYSQRALGQYDRSAQFHQEALEIARTSGDRACEIANLNHLSRTYVAKEDYTEAINYSQRALILSRQTGDRTGEANALVNLGYSEVMQAQQTEDVEPETYETAINYLQQGLALSEKLGDLQSKALCVSSLGIAFLVIQQPQAAIKYLEEGFKIAQTAGDLHMQGVNLGKLAEAYYHLQNQDKAIYTGCLGMYLLNQIASHEWRKPAGLLTILHGQIGAEAFNNLLQQHRSKIISVIGVDGYDHIPHLLEEYKRSM